MYSILLWIYRIQHCIFRDALRIIIEVDDLQLVMASPDLLITADNMQIIQDDVQSTSLYIVDTFNTCNIICMHYVYNHLCKLVVASLCNWKLYSFFEVERGLLPLGICWCQRRWTVDDHFVVDYLMYARWIQCDREMAERYVTFNRKHTCSKLTLIIYIQHVTITVLVIFKFWLHSKIYGWKDLTGFESHQEDIAECFFGWLKTSPIIN